MATKPRQYLRGVMDSIVEQADIDSAVKRIEALLDASVVVDNAEAFSAKEFEAQYKVVQRGEPWNLSPVNVDKLREEFKKAPFKNIEIAALQAFSQRKLADMLAQNTTRGDFLQRLQNVIDANNQSSFRFWKMYHPSPPSPAPAPKMSSAAMRVRHAWPSRSSGPTGWRAGRLARLRRTNRPWWPSLNRGAPQPSILICAAFTTSAQRLISDC